MKPVQWKLTADIEVEPIDGNLTIEPSEIARLLREAMPGMTITSIRLSKIETNPTRVD